MQFQSQDNVGVEVDPHLRAARRPFAISPGITLPLGAEYRFTRFARPRSDGEPPTARAQRALRDRRVLLGHRKQTVLGLTVRARPGYIFSLNGEWNESIWPRGASRRTCFADR